MSDSDSDFFDDVTDHTVSGEAPLMGRKAISHGVPALEQISGDGAPRMFRLTGERYVVGRSSSADLRFDCEKLSRQHLEVYRVERGFAFRDLESTNGVYLNGVKALGVNLCQGDQLQIGNLVLVYHEVVL